MALGTLVVTAAPTETLAAERATTLAEFARACKGAARAVSLYPRTHPAIRAALDRLTMSAARLIAGPDVTLEVHPGALLIDGRSPVRPDLAIAELAALMHERLVGEIRIERDADADDWHALLVLLGRSPEELLAAGGFTKALTATGRQHFSVREIDYAEVLRERAVGREAEWDRIIATCLDGDASALDDRALAVLLETLEDQALFVEFLDRLQTADDDSPHTMGARTAALLEMLRGAMDAVAARGDNPDRVLQAAADAAARFTPELILALIHERSNPSSELGAVADGILNRISDESIAGLVATSVAVEQGATERLAQAFEALVSDAERKDSLLDMAREASRQSPLGQDAGFEKLWQSAREMLLSYSDTNYVSAEYARELSAARSHALEIERLADDPPERVEAWLATVSDDSVRHADLAMLCDLLRIESDPAKWAGMVNLVVPEIERHTLLGNTEGARQLAELVAAEMSDQGRWDFSIEAGKALERLATGPLVRHVILHLRKVDDAEVTRLARLCHVIGPSLVRPLAEALAVEDSNRSIRRLRELLLGFGAAGRQSVEQLKSSSNPAVRRTAIDLLRVFGGSEALPELASMLGDSDPQVQRESIRAIVQIATPQAYAVLQRALLAGGATRETMLRELVDLRDDRAIPVLCYALEQTRPRGKLAQLHASVIDALGALSPHSDSTRALRGVLYAGEWWAPLRTSGLRRAAALALRRMGTEEAKAVLEEAAARGTRGIRRAARADASITSRRERERV